MSKREPQPLNFNQRLEVHRFVVQRRKLTLIPEYARVEQYRLALCSDDGEEAYLPEYIINKTKDIAPYSADDIIAPDTKAILLSQGHMSDSFMLQNTIPHALPIIEKFHPRKIITEHATLKYITIAVRAPDCPLKNMANIILSGMSPYETYQKVVKPTLDKTQ